MDATEELAWKFRALSNPHRLTIFQYLAAECEPGESSTDDEMHASVGELSNLLEIAPSTVSHHLRELRQAGLIRMQRRGREVDCWVEPALLEQMGSVFTHWLSDE